MKIARNITIFISAVLFLLSSTGVLVYHSHCSCTGSEQVSLFTAPETCEENYHVHHSHDGACTEVPVSMDECHECSAHAEDCGCNTPEVRLFKLDDQVLQEKVRVLNARPALVALLNTLIIHSGTNLDQTQAAMHYFADPPPLIRSALDFLIQIQQLKIPIA